MTDPMLPPQNTLSSKPPLSRIKWLWALPLLAFAGLAILLGSRLGHNPEVINQTTTGHALPAFKLPNLADGSLSTNAQLPKTPFVLNVWGSWCPSCRVEHSQLLNLAKQGIPIVGVDYKDSSADALQYLAERGNPFMLNLQDEQGTLGVDLGLTGAPETFLVDGQGQIRYHIIGALNADRWETELKPCWQRLQQKTADVEPVCQTKVGFNVKG